MIAIIKGCGNNIASIQYALNRLGAESVFTDNETLIRNAGHVILPGVGQASTAMNNLRAKQLDQVLPTLTQPVLGICLGMQLLYEYSEENDTKGLGIVPGEINYLGGNKIIPHMGWNTLKFLYQDSIFNDVAAKMPYTYFVHSYAAPVNEFTISTTHYGNDFTSIVRRDNFFGMQFHPEKSSETGSQLLKQFLDLRLT